MAKQPRATTTVTTEKDPYMLDPETAHKAEQAMKGGDKGRPCPRRNIELGKSCAVCERVSALYDSKTEENKAIAKKKKATATFWINAVTAQDQNKCFLFEIGKKIGEEIILGIKSKGWLDISHPSAGKGREMSITKTQTQGEEYPTYSVSPVLNKAEWEIPKEALDGRFDLEKILELYNDPSIPHKRASDLKTGETFVFRILPALMTGKLPLKVLWRHYGVSQGELEGTSPLSFGGGTRYTTPKPELTKPSSDTSSEENESPFEETKTEVASGKKACFGYDSCYEEVSRTGNECNSPEGVCPLLKACGEAVAKGKVK